MLAGGEILTMAQEPNSATIEAPKVGWVATQDGKIALVTYDKSEADKFLADNPACNVVDCSGMVLMPGLINTHTHVSMTLMRNMTGDMELMEWLNDHIWPFEALQSEDDITAGAKLGMAEMILGGTTAFVDMYWTEVAVAKAAEQMGMRALLAESVLDGREDSFKENLARLVERCKGSELLRPAVGPHAPFTCSPATMKLSVETAKKYDTPLTIHISESPSEQPMVAERYGVTPTEYTAKHGALTNRTIIAHAVHLTDNDIEIIAKSGASVAHNVQSNMKLASGVAPITELVRRGVNCTVATDSASSNNDLNMWEEIRTTPFLQRVVSLDPMAISGYDVLYMATRNAARAIGYTNDELGIIRTGALADIIAVDLTAPHMRPRHNTISALVYCATAADVRHVVIGGELRLKDRALVNAPATLEQIINDAESRALALRAQAQRQCKSDS